MVPNTAVCSTLAKQHCSNITCSLLFRLVCMYLQEGGVAFLLANLPGTVDHSTVGSLRPLGHEAGLDDIQGGGGNTCD
jgi:hypothetical protein